ncbi:hypothetical protein FIBSPDRAFT_954417 [Athelia psychrophila]|uniref:Uncharacterized protein n=1 Tax=Athelia psychrophila TaxID=1759441 RepID=A0A166JCZ5_9AGAM|nr:hypothetical protein FIBSPDRAFT_954417 [Fibularhizoctonia sp. CBS 109695]
MISRETGKERWHKQGNESTSAEDMTKGGRAWLSIEDKLYASLADVLARTPALRALLRTDPPRAYFASVALAVLEVATCALTPDGAVVGVLGRELTLKECPVALRPLMLELGGIARLAREVEEADTEEAMRRAQAGEDIPPPRMERVRAMLQEGVGHDMDVHADGGGGEDEKRGGARGGVCEPHQ